MGYDSRGIGLKAQKKLVSKMCSKPLVMSLIDDTSAEVLDNLHKVLKQYKDKKEADKVLKYVIKSVLKVGILSRNDQFNQQELNFLEDFATKFREIATSFISYYRDKSTCDKAFLQNSLEECRILAQTIIDRHLKAKSKNGVDLVFHTFSEQGFLDMIFNDESCKEYMDKIVDGLEQLKADGYL